MNVLAIDLGATSGRAILGVLDNGTIELNEISRFNNYSNHEEDEITWNINKIMKEIFSAMVKAEKKYGFDSIAVDTWGVDIGLLDSEGDLIRNPVHYRDERNKGMIDEAIKKMSLRDLYDGSGIQIMEINTLFQLLQLKKNEPEVYDKTSSMLLMPDLINYLLAGKKYAEKSIASTTQLFNPKTLQWNEELIKDFGLKENLFPPILSPGKEIGVIKDSILKELNIPAKKVISIASHDTASAVLSVPSKDDNFTFLSSGTWSLLGQQLNEPIINDETFALNVANEVGADDKITFLSNITGMWILEECKKYYANQGIKYSYKDIMDLSAEVKNNNTFIDVDDEAFVSPNEMPAKIKKYAKNTKQEIPDTPAEIFRVIYESLALKYKFIETKVSNSTKLDLEKLYIVGGGSKANILNQMTADAMNKRVIAGPSEATSMGNVIMQFYTLGYIATIDEAKSIVGNLDEVREYSPESTELWNDKYQKFLSILK